MWAHLGLNQGPPDYESGAANQLSYGPEQKHVFVSTVQIYKEIEIIKICNRRYLQKRLI